MKSLIITTLLILTMQVTAQEYDDSEHSRPIKQLDRKCYRECITDGYTAGYCLKQCEY